MLYEQDPMLKRYLEDISHYPRIDNDREKELAIIIQESDDEVAVEKAKEELVLSNLRLVVKYALDYYPKIRHMADVNLSLMDLINEGNLGLWRAAELFKADKGVTFSTYAYISIQRRIKRGIKSSRFMRLPINHFKYIAELKSLEEEYEERKKVLTDDIIKERLEITDDILELIKQNRNPMLSIEGLTSDTNDGYGETLSFDPVDEGPCADENASSRELREYLYDKMKELKPNHRDVLYMKFFGNRYMTLEEMGDRKGLTRERIRQIIPQALRALKRKIQKEAAIMRLNGSEKDAVALEEIERRMKLSKDGERGIIYESKNVKTKSEDSKPKRVRTYRSKRTTSQLPFIKSLRGSDSDEDGGQNNG